MANRRRRAAEKARPAGDVDTDRRPTGTLASSRARRARTCGRIPGATRGRRDRRGEVASGDTRRRAARPTTRRLRAADTARDREARRRPGIAGRAWPRGSGLRRAGSPPRILRRRARPLVGRAHRTCRGYGPPAPAVFGGGAREADRPSRRARPAIPLRPVAKSPRSSSEWDRTASRRRLPRAGPTRAPASRERRGRRRRETPGRLPGPRRFQGCARPPGLGSFRRDGAATARGRRGCRRTRRRSRHSRRWTRRRSAGPPRRPASARAR